MGQGGSKSFYENFLLRPAKKTIRALKIAAEGQKADIAKPMKGLGAGVYEIVLRHESSAYRVVYTVQIGADLWVDSYLSEKVQEEACVNTHTRYRRD